MKNFLSLAWILVICFSMTGMNYLSAQTNKAGNTPHRYLVKPGNKKKTANTGYKNVIAFSPLLKNPKIKFEHAFPSGFSLGTNAKLYLGDNPGITAEPFGRYYFRQRAPKGFYMQAKGIMGWTKSTYSSLVDEAIDGATSQAGIDINGEAAAHNVYNYGFGLAGGYQFLLGRQDRFALDLLAGYQRTNNSGAINEEDWILKVKRNFPLEIGLKIGVAF